jgi:predicted ATP-dependent endonuclease of OLD family
LCYSYIGLQECKSNSDNIITKGTEELNQEFLESLKYCKMFKKAKWKTSIGILESDPLFKESKIKDLVDIEDGTDFQEQALNIFNNLSSGHKIVLLTITKIIENLQEKSLVLIDEPEAHLHPPLLSAFIRTLSELLILTNGVAIIVTHSPVVLQEVPKSCVWKLRRYGEESIAERLEIESFGENVGILTREIFGLEVTDSGFHKMLQSLTQEHSTYESAIRKLGGQLGFEGKAILRNLFYDKLCEE